MKLQTQGRHKEPGDAEIVARVLSGEPSAFATLVNRHSDRLIRGAYRRLQDWHTAEDVCQEAFLASYRRLSKLRNPEHYAAWLNAIMKNRCRMAERSRKREEQNIDLELYEDTKRPAADESISKGEATAIASKLCELLSESQAPVARMFYIEGCRDQEIANELDISLSAVHSRLHKARMRLKNSTLVGNERNQKTAELIFGLIEQMKEKYVMDTIRIELSRELISCIKPDPDTDRPGLIEGIRELRQEIRESDGIEIPRVRIIDNLSLAESVCEISILGTTVVTKAMRKPEEIVVALRDSIQGNQSLFTR